MKSRSGGGLGGDDRLLAPLEGLEALGSAGVPPRQEQHVGIVLEGVARRELVRGALVRRRIVRKGCLGLRPRFRPLLRRCPLLEYLLEPRPPLGLALRAIRLSAGLGRSRGAV